MSNENITILKQGDGIEKLIKLLQNPPKKMIQAIVLCITEDHEGAMVSTNLTVYQMCYLRAVLDMRISHLMGPPKIL